MLSIHYSQQNNYLVTDKTLSDLMARAGKGGVRTTPVNFPLSENCPKIFSLENFCPKMQNLGLKTSPILGGQTLGAKLKF